MLRPETDRIEQRLPVVGEHVQLVVGELRLDARVHATPPGRLELALPFAPIDVRRSRDLSAQVHSVHETGICRVLGRLRMLSGRGDEGVLVELTYAGTPQLMLRREHVRAGLSTPIALALPSGTVHTRTINVSAGGLLVAGPVRVNVSDLVPVFFRLPGSRTGVSALARVVRRTTDGHIGIALVAVTEADQARLTLAVFDERRREPRARVSPARTAYLRASLQCADTVREAVAVAVEPNASVTRRRIVRRPLAK
jgi:PilZ domain